MSVETYISLSVIVAFLIGVWQGICVAGIWQRRKAKRGDE